ncbi:hypothetical protein GQ43DRAFT_8025 [Delitschia confertaspora ATCC 74209]|uniref:Uncharacterized protein n=1 Tax=Delitschia confertaspora ATCC 74209 TaxID=1513339 RepID=A0A9P4JPT4_9PLEO|nr:hypothetical protein GQ43DRAFT_8025 [Delitschia confertaspora ATCC 74209]
MFARIAFGHSSTALSQSLASRNHSRKPAPPSKPPMRLRSRNGVNSQACLDAIHRVEMMTGQSAALLSYPITASPS